MAKIKRLSVIIEQPGKRFTRIDSASQDFDAYIYQVESETVTMYEVFRPNVKKTSVKQEYYSEIYPKTADFGKTAFGVADIADAKILMHQMCKEGILSIGKPYDRNYLENN